jgi:hypothetical protein
MGARSGARYVSITGNLMPWNTDRPVMVIIEGQRFVPVYSSEDKLRASMVECGWDQEYTIKQVTDGRDFLDSLNEARVFVCLDPHLVDGVTRFTLCM